MRSRLPRTRGCGKPSRADPPGRRSPRPSPQRGPSSPRPSAVPAEGDSHRLCRQSHCFSLKATINRILFYVLFFYCFTLLRFCGPGAVSGCARPTCGSGHTSNALRVALSPGVASRPGQPKRSHVRARPGPAWAESPGPSSWPTRPRPGVTCARRGWTAGTRRNPQKTPVRSSELHFK